MLYVLSVHVTQHLFDNHRMLAVLALLNHLLKFQREFGSKCRYGEGKMTEVQSNKSMNISTEKIHYHPPIT